MLSTLTLADGRTVEHLDAGTPDGIPLIFFHGTPSTGGQGAVVAEAARSHGVRLIAPSRPGYGISTMSPPGLARTADDTLELADQLGIGRFALLGSSGGGPFALAMAAAAPDRVSAIAVLASPGNYAEVKPEVLGDEDRRALDLAAAGQFEDALEVMNTVADADLQGMRGLSAEEFSAALAKMGPPGGGWLNRHPELLQLFEDDFRRAITTSDGMSRDNLSWLREWDFDPASVSIRVQLVYGESDRMAEVAHGEWLRDHLSDSELRVIPGDHGAVAFGAAEPFFATLATS